jgi:CheY-like chemotaxis protein
MSRILLVDDAAAIRNVVSQMLAGAGHDVVAIEPRHLEHAAQQPFDLLITDMIMPEMDGLQVIARMRQIQPTIKVIAISGRPWRTDGQPLDGLRVTHAITKPFRKADLLTLVNDCLTKI